MRGLRILAVATTCVACLYSVAQGQVTDDVELVTQIIEENDRAWKTGDVKTILKYDHPHYSFFSGNGGLLAEGQPEPAELQAMFDAGLKWDVLIRHLKVLVFGDTAVVTSYFVGTVTRSESDGAEKVARRVTNVLARVNGEWHWVHDHISPIAVP